MSSRLGPDAAVSIGGSSMSCTSSASAAAGVGGDRDGAEGRAGVVSLCGGLASSLAWSCCRWR